MTEPVVIPLGPALVNITGVRAGDRNRITATIKSNGVPMDLTGYTVAAQARKKSTDANSALEANVTVTDAVAGAIEMEWPGADVASLLATSATWAGVWDLQLSSGPSATTIAAGTFEAVMDVTRP